MRTTGLTFLTAAAGLALALPGTATAQDAWTRCGDYQATDREAACSQLIDSGRLDDLDLLSVYEWRISARIERKDYEGATADADRLSALAPDSAAGHAIRCITRAMWGRDLDVANQACAEALRQSDFVAFRTAQGLLRLRQGRDHEAWVDFDISVRDGDQQSEQPLYGRGIAALRIGRVAEGRADIAAALAINVGVAQTFADWGILPPAR